MSAQEKSRDCPFCGDQEVKILPRYCRDDWLIGRCVKCDFVFLSNPVEYSELEETYSWDKTYVQEKDAREKNRGILKKFAQRVRQFHYEFRGDAQAYYEHYLGKGGRILDIGCADVVRFDEPFIPHGIEISKGLANAADAKMKAKGGYCLNDSGADGVWNFENDFFDNAILHSYLEHEVNVESVIAGLFRALKPGAPAFIRVPNFNSLNRIFAQSSWPGFRYPDHVNYFTKKSLKAFCTRAGFEFKLINRSNLWLDDNIKAVISKPISHAA